MGTYRIGMYVKEVLRYQGKTQKDLAEHLGVSKQLLSNNLRGANNISIELLMRIAQYLDVSVEKIVNLDRRKPRNHKSYAKLKKNRYDEYMYPDFVDQYGESVIDYLYQSNSVNKFIYLYKSKTIPNTRFSRTKMCEFLVRMKLYDIFDYQLSLEESFNNGEIKMVNYNPIFPNLRYSSRKIAERINIGEPTILEYGKAEQDYITSIMDCRDERILNLIPKIFYTSHYRNKRTKTSIKETKLDIFNPYIRVALETDNLFVFKFFWESYNFSINDHHLKIAKAFESMKIVEFINELDQIDQDYISSIKDPSF